MRQIAPLVFLVLLSLPALAGEPQTLIVEKTDFVQAIEAEGRVTPGTVVEFRLSPLAWRGRYTVLTALEPGQVVREGEVVMTFRAIDIQKALDDARFALSVAEREFAAQMARLKTKSRASVLDLARKVRDRELAEAALQNYLEFTLPMSNERARRSALSYGRSVENARDELDQLEKMYAEDELVDETEDIVLKRARWDLENRLANQERQQKQRKFDLEFTEKVRRKTFEIAVRQKRFDLERAEQEAQLAQVARAIEAEKALRSIEDRRKGVAELAADLSDFTLRAPCQGVLLHGDRDGALDRKLKRGDQLGAEAVAFVIVVPESLEARLSVPAAEILRVAPGQTVRMKPTATGVDEVEGVIATRNILPRSGRVPFVVKPSAPFAPALLGVAVKGKVILKEVKDVLVVPLTAVQREGTKALCRRPLDGGGTRLVPVILGPDDGKRVVVLQGLSEGDEILVGESGE